jgi:hypothetical protein
MLEEDTGIIDEVSPELDAIVESSNIEGLTLEEDTDQVYHPILKDTYSDIYEKLHPSEKFPTYVSYPHNF